MGQRQQPVIELDNGAPVGPAAGPPRGIHRLHRRLELESSDPAIAARPLQQPLGFVDRRGIPQRRFLFGQWHVAAVGIAPCGPPRAGIKHQREQTQTFRLLGQQSDHYMAEPDRLVEQSLAPRIEPGRIRPPAPKAA